MNKWKELKIDNLPPDILTGDYEWEMVNLKSRLYSECKWRGVDILMHLNGANRKYDFAYRKPEPKPPTHEEIMTKWWKVDSQNSWQRVRSYYPEDEGKYGIGGICYRTNWFIGRESATLPPEIDNER